MKIIEMEDYVDTFNEAKLDEIIKSLRFLASLEGQERLSGSISGYEKNLRDIEQVVELAADCIQRFIAEMRRNEISKSTYETIVSLNRFSSLKSTAVIRVYERGAQGKCDICALFEHKLELLGKTV